MKRNGLFLGIALLSLLTSIGCEKDPGKSIGEIEVFDEQGRTVANASVRIYCTEALCVVEREGLSDSRGIFREEFEKPVVLAIEAYKLDTTLTDTGTAPNVGFIIEIDSAFGEGFITIEEGKTISRPVVLLPKTP